MLGLHRPSFGLIINIIRIIPHISKEVLVGNYSKITKWK